jgi:N-acetylglucosamine-6-phosphate deacetylase
VPRGGPAAGAGDGRAGPLGAQGVSGREPLARERPRGDHLKTLRLGVEAALVRGELVRGDVALEDGHVARVGLSPSGKRGIAVPGFVDLQVNGFAGIDFLTASTADYEQAGEALLAAGVTAYQPTFITAPEEMLVEALRAMPAASNGGPQIIGAHLDGPFLSPERLGTHPPEHRRDPDVALLDRLLDAGNVTTLTLAPELAGAELVVRRARERGVVVGAGHTNATAEEAHAAFDNGVTTVSHIFNAMRPFTQRDPGVSGAALARPDVVVQMIVDGCHLADETVRLVWAVAAGRVALVSDATAAAGAGPGTYRLGPVEINVTNGAPLRADGVIAGTALTMLEAVRNLHALGASFEDAVGAATIVPARLLGRPDLGTLEAGVVVLDDRLDVISAAKG